MVPTAVVRDHSEQHPVMRPVQRMPVEDQVTQGAAGDRRREGENQTAERIHVRSVGGQDLAAKDATPIKYRTCRITVLLHGVG